MKLNQSEDLLCEGMLIVFVYVCMYDFFQCHCICFMLDQVSLSPVEGNQKKKHKNSHKNLFTGFSAEFFLLFFSFGFSIFLDIIIIVIFGVADCIRRDNKDEEDLIT